MFTGSLVALITPFKNGSVDEKGFEKFVAWQIKEGTDGLVPCGTTGEGATLTDAEHRRLIEIAVEVAAGTLLTRPDVVELIGTLGDPATEQPLQPIVIESVTASSS